MGFVEPSVLREFVRAACGYANTCPDRVFIDACSVVTPLSKRRHVVMTSEQIDLALHLYLHTCAPIAFDASGNLVQERLIAYLAENLESSPDAIRRAIDQDCLTRVRVDTTQSLLRLNHTCLEIGHEDLAVHYLFTLQRELASDSRVDCLHWRNASGENILHLLMRGGWKDPANVLREIVEGDDYLALLHGPDHSNTSPFEYLARSGNVIVAQDMVNPEDLLHSAFIRRADRIDRSHLSDAMTGLLIRWLSQRSSGILAENIFHLPVEGISGPPVLDALAALLGPTDTRKLLEQRSSDHYTPFGCAILRGDLDQAEWIFRHSLPWDKPALSCAAVSEYLEECGRLCHQQNARALVTHCLGRFRTSDGTSFPHLCVRLGMNAQAWGQIRDVLDTRTLIAGLCAPDRSGLTGFELAASQENVLLLQWIMTSLRESGEDLRKHVATFARFAQLKLSNEVKRLIRGYLQEPVAGEPGNFLHMLSEQKPEGDIGGIMRLAGASAVPKLLEQADGAGRTVLARAIQCGNLPFVYWIVFQGCCIPESSHQVIARHLPECIRQLAKASPEIKQQAGKYFATVRAQAGLNVCHLAAKYVQDACLLDTLRDITGIETILTLLPQDDKHGNTPMNLAIHHGNLKFIQWAVLNDYGIAPEKRIATRRAADFCKRIYELTQASASGRPALMKSLCETTLTNGVNLFHLAAQYIDSFVLLDNLRRLTGTDAMLKLLFQHDDRIDTPLGCAIEHNNTTFVAWVILDGGGILSEKEMSTVWPVLLRNGLMQLADALSTKKMKADLFVRNLRETRLTTGKNIFHVAAMYAHDIDTLDRLRDIIGRAHTRTMLSDVQVEHKAKRTTPLGDAARYANAVAVDWIIVNGELGRDFLIRHPDDLTGVGQDMIEYLYRCGFRGREPLDALRSTPLALLVAPNYATYFGLIHGNWSGIEGGDGPPGLTRWRLPCIQELHELARFNSMLSALLRTSSVKRRIWPVMPPTRQGIGIEPATDAEQNERYERLIRIPFAEDWDIDRAALPAEVAKVDSWLETNLKFYYFHGLGQLRTEERLPGLPPSRPPDMDDEGDRQ